MLVGARELAAKIASNSPIVVQGAKKMLNYTMKYGVDAVRSDVEVIETYSYGADSYNHRLITGLGIRQGMERVR